MLESPVPRKFELSGACGPWLASLLSVIECNLGADGTLENCVKIDAKGNLDLKKEKKTRGSPSYSVNAAFQP